MQHPIFFGFIHLLMFSLGFALNGLAQGSPINPAFLVSPEFHADNRHRLLQQLPPNSAVVIFSNTLQRASEDQYFLFRQNSNLLYLTGYHQPDAVLMLSNIDGRYQERLFIAPVNLSNQVWNGYMYTFEAAQETFEITTAHPDTFSQYVERFWSSIDQLYVDVDTAEVKQESTFKSAYQQGKLWAQLLKMPSYGEKAQPQSVLKFEISKLRVIKQTEEIALLKQAVALTHKTQQKLQQLAKTAQNESELHAEVLYQFKRHGADGEAFNSIIGSGANSCVLHYTDNNAVLDSGATIVCDIGAAVKGYAADITRTYIARSDTSEQQKAIFELVYQAQLAGAAACVEGAPFTAIYQAAAQVIAQGLVDLGITQNSAEYRNYFMHGVSHYVGLDVHDPGPKEKLQVGNVLTIEPGIYIAANSPCDPKWWNIGVRIEDVFEVTSAACVKWD